MSLLVIVLIVLLLCGGGFGYSRYPQYGDRIGIVGIVLVCLLLYFLFSGRL